MFRIDDVEPPDAPLVADHDLDGFFDDDNCPLIASSDQSDDDADSIGNVCDPHPGELDTIVLQHRFPEMASDWSYGAGQTPVETGLQSPAPADGGVIASSARTLYRPALQVSFTLVGFDETDDLREVLLQLDILDGAGLIYDCALRGDIDLTSMSQVIVHAGSVRKAETVSPDYAPGNPYLATYRRGLVSQCDVAGSARYLPTRVTNTPLRHRSPSTPCR